MRAISSFLVGIIISLAAFSIFWSIFVVKHHSYGGDSRLSQIEGTFAFFVIYIFPFLVAAVLLVVLPIELTFIRKRQRGARRGIRRLTWGIVATCGLAVPVGIASPDHGISAAICGLAAATMGGCAYGRIAAEAPENENG